MIIEQYLPLLLDIEERDPITVSKQEHACACIKYLITGRSCYFFGNFILHILDHQLGNNNKYKIFYPKSK